MVSAEGPTGWSQHVSGRDLGGSNAPPPLENGSPNGQWVGVGPSDDNDDAGGDQRALMVSTNSPRRTLSCSDRWARGGLPQLLSVAAML